MQENLPLRESNTVRWIAVTAMLMAVNIVMSSFGIPVPGGHLYLNDLIICTAAILLDPTGAYLVGGMGAFIGDLLFYPAPMFVSLITHGLQAIAISLLCRKNGRPVLGRTVFAVIVGTLINIVGYTIGRAYVYSTPEYAVLKLPYQCLQAAFGAAVAVLLCFRGGLLKFWDRFCEAKQQNV